MNWSVAHERSERLAEQAHAARRDGRAEDAAHLFVRAAEEEEIAYRSLDPSKIRTLGITAVSAAALFHKGNASERAERFAHEALAHSPMPPFACVQLREIIQDIWNEIAQREAGVAFVPGQITVSVKGGEVVRGGAPLDLILNKVQVIQTLYVRTAEFLKQAPFRRKGPATKAILDHFRPWLFQTVPGSYQFVVAVQKPAQSDLFPENDPDPELLTSTFLSIVKASVDGTPDDIAELVPDPDYRRTFLRLSRDLAPSGKRFERLELLPAEGIEGVVLLPRSRAHVSDQLKPMIRVEEADETRENVQGTLRAVDLDKDWLEVVQDVGGSVRVTNVSEVVDDVIGPMVNRRVTVRVIRQGKETRFVDIDVDD